MVSSSGNVGFPLFTSSSARPVSDDVIDRGTRFPTPVSRMAYFRGRKFTSQSLSEVAKDLLGEN